MQFQCIFGINYSTARRCFGLTPRERLARLHHTRCQTIITLRYHTAGNFAAVSFVGEVELRLKLFVIPWCKLANLRHGNARATRSVSPRRTRGMKKNDTLSDCVKNSRLPARDPARPCPFQRPQSLTSHSFLPTESDQVTFRGAVADCRAYRSGLAGMEGKNAGGSRSTLSHSDGSGVVVLRVRSGSTMYGSGTIFRLPRGALSGAASEDAIRELGLRSRSHEFACRFRLTNGSVGGKCMSNF